VKVALEREPPGRHPARQLREPEVKKYMGGGWTTSRRRWESRRGGAVALVEADRAQGWVVRLLDERGRRAAGDEGSPG
jgi:hypothetical protein